MTDYARWERFITDEAGNIVPTVSIEVRKESDGLLATIFSGRTGGALANPFTTSTDGLAAFHAAGIAGGYQVRAYLGPSGAPTFETFFRYQPVGTAAENDHDTFFSGLSASQQAEQRAYLSSASLSAMAARNVVINGAVDVSQELGTTGATLVNNTAKYIVDQAEAMYNHGAATAVVTSAQLAAASFPSALAGFSFAHRIKATTAISSPASGDFAKYRKKIEGYRVAKWGWGASGAAAIVVAFNLYSTASGTAFVRLSNSAANRFYYHEITVAAGWNFYAFNVAGDTSGTWVKDNGIGLVFEIFVSGKETTPQSSLDAWGSTAKVQTTNSGNLLGTNDNLTLLTGTYIAADTQLPLIGDMPGLMRSFDQELLLCLRYLWSYQPIFIAVLGLTDGVTIFLNNMVPFRANPTITHPFTDGTFSTAGSPTGSNWNLQQPGVGTATKTGTASFATIAGREPGKNFIYVSGATFSRLATAIAGGSGIGNITLDARL